MWKNFDIAEIYSVEELLPIVAHLAKKYTSGESSSVTYEQAERLMESVVYCIRHFYEGKNQKNIIATKKIPEDEAYKLGYEIVYNKVKNTQEKYNRLMTFFCHYGNENYRDTVEKGLAGFFLTYDVVFAPKENIITMDYPIFGMDMTLTGIDMIAQYLDRIYQEQIFLQSFPKEYVLNKLRMFHANYEKEFFNLKEIVMK